ncbi:copper-binding protein [Acidithiobacillus ferriphilus]|uniref:copper-binding protein n=1 Tax=Acidithiobacillus ferriphilus TaxID=1689834 RepID=UPI004056A344
MKRFYLALILLCSSAVTLPAQAAMDNMGGTKNMAGAQAVKAQIFMGHGKINSINPTGTVNVAMGPVKALDWPKMSMNFLVMDKAMLASLKIGEHVNFDFSKDTAGGYVITMISPAK